MRAIGEAGRGRWRRLEERIEEVPLAVVDADLATGDPTRPGPGRRRWGWPARAAVAGLLAAFVVASVALFAIPHNAAPPHADAVVVLGGPGERLARGEALVRQGVAPILVISEGIRDCPPPAIPNVRIICFNPDPFTTQGEARYVAAAARRFGWRHLVVVTSTDQRTRAELRFGRCTDTSIDYVTTPPPAWEWPYLVAYQWAALGKALALQRTC